jgi:hypothetical protein
MAKTKKMAIYSFFFLFNVYVTWNNFFKSGHKANFKKHPTSYYIGHLNYPEKVTMISILLSHDFT